VNLWMGGTRAEAQRRRVHREILPYAMDEAVLALAGLLQR